MMLLVGVIVEFICVWATASIMAVGIMIANEAVWLTRSPKHCLGGCVLFGFGLAMLFGLAVSA